jgi:hypothetical protein
LPSGDSDRNKQLRQVLDLGPPRFMLGSALRLGGNLILEVRQQFGPVGSGVLGRQLRAAHKTVAQLGAAFDAIDVVDPETPLVPVVVGPAAKLWWFPAKASGLLWFLWRWLLWFLWLRLQWIWRRLEQHQDGSCG